jgi:uncharacterized phosphatase
MKTTFYLVRHGETSWNAEGKIQGRSDIPLGDIGREQAKKLGEKLTSVHFDAIYTSPLQRAVETAEIIGNILSLPVQIQKELRERNSGNLEGKTKEEMRALYPDWNTMSEEQKFIDDREGTE